MSDNQDMILYLKVSPHNYEAVNWKHQTFKNSFGTWHVYIKYEPLVSAKDALWFEGCIYVEDTILCASKIDIRLYFKSVITQKLNSVTTQESIYGTIYYFRGIVNVDLHCNIDVEITITPSESVSNTQESTSETVKFSKEMFESGKLADVMIKTKDENEIAAHNFFLSRSDVFDAMLNTDMKEAQTKVIEITDVDHDVLTEMIRFLYCDEVPMIKEMAIDLLVAGDKYNIQGLVDECVKFLLQNVTMENHGRILAVADQLNIKTLKEAAIDFVVENRKEIFATESWKELKQNNVQLALEIMEKNMSIS